jgi:hypothetical protein
MDYFELEIKGLIEVRNQRLDNEINELMKT